MLITSGKDEGGVLVSSDKDQRMTIIFSAELQVKWVGHKLLQGLEDDDNMFSRIKGEMGCS